MKRFIKNCFSIILTIAVIFSSVYMGFTEIDFGGVFVIKANAAKSDLVFQLNEDGASYTVTGCNPAASGELIIPAKYKKMPVTNIGDWAFDGCISLTAVTIPDSVKKIGEFAFCDCKNLKKIQISEGVEYIDYAAFIGCENVTSIVIPDTVTHIGGFTFASCKKLTSIKLSENITEIAFGLFENSNSIKKIVVPEGVTAVGTGAFQRCANLIEIKLPKTLKTIGNYAFSESPKIKSITIPSKVKEIGKRSFEGCYGLGIINVDSNNKYYSSIDGVLFNKKQDVLEAFPANYHDTEYEIPNSVTEIAYNAFYGADSLSRVSIPSSVKSIGDCAFINSGIESVYIGKGVSEIGSLAIGYKSGSEEFSGELVSDFKIYGRVNTAAEKYAVGNKIKFIKHEKHTESEWITDKKATINVSGTKHKECKVCGMTIKTTIIKQLKCAKPTLKTITNSQSGVKITWGKVTGADSYGVYRKVDGGSYSKVGSTSKAFFTDKTAKSGKKYHYFVRAINEAGNSLASSTLAIKHLAVPVLKTPVSAKDGINLKWNKIAGAQGYLVYRKTGDGSYSKLITVKGLSKISYVDKSAKKGKKYTYKVKAYYSKTYSAYSNTKTLKDKY